MKTMKRRKRCDDCGDLFDADEILDGRCEECDGHYTYCVVCQEEQHQDRPCRHVFLDRESWQWMGCGSPDAEWKHHRKSFLCVLDKTGLASELRAAIEADTLSTLYLSGYIGSPDYICHAGAGESRGSYGDRFTKDLTEDDERAMTPGVGWLDSIQYGDSPIRAKARDLTIRWIDEWLACPFRRLGAGYGLAASAFVRQREYESRRWDAHRCKVPLPAPQTR